MIKGAILFSPGPFGGAEKLILESMREIELPILIIRESRNPKPAEKFIEKIKEKYIPYRVFESTKRYDKKLIQELNHYIQTKDLKFIHSHGLKANFINSYLNIKKIATQHGQTSHTLKMKIMEFIENRALKKMDKTILVSEIMFNNYSEPNKVLLENFIPVLPKFEHIKRDSRPIKLIFAGRLSNEKGIQFLINSLPTELDLELHIFGNGELESYVQTKVNDKVIFHSFSDNIIEEFLKCDLLIIPSKREGLPLVALEACAIGIPVFATKVGGLPKLLGSEHLLFDYGNKEEFQQKLSYIINNYSAIHQDFQEIKKMTRENYSKEKWCKNLIDIYKSL